MNHVIQSVRLLVIALDDWLERHQQAMLEVPVTPDTLHVYPGGHST